MARPEAPLRELNLADLTRKVFNLEALMDAHRHDNTGSQSIPANAITDGTVGGFLQSQNFITGAAGTGWRLSPDGTLEASEGNFRGDITGSTGSFTGSITIGTGNNVVKADGTDGLWVGHVDFASAPFKVSLAGVLTATGAIISGTLTATAGAIGGFDIGADYIRDAANSFGMASTVTGGDDVRFWAGDTFANRATAPLRMTEAGAITVTSLTIAAGTSSGIDQFTDAGDLVTINESAIDTSNITNGAGFTDDTAADLRTTTFFQSGIPTSLAAGDLWIDSDDGKGYRATGVGDTTIGASAWVRIDTGLFPALIDALQTTNAPAAAGADVTANNTANDTTNVNGLASTTIISGGLIGTNLVVANSINVINLSVIGNADLGSITAGSISVVDGANTIGLTPAGTNAIFSGTTGSPEFKVTPAGVLTATGAVITGTINATAGTFSGSIVVSGTLTGGDIQTASGTGSRVVMDGGDNALYLYDSGNKKRVQLQTDGLTLFDSSGNESGSFTGRGTGEIDIIPSGSGTLFITGQITASALIFSSTDIVATSAFVPAVDNVTILGETSPSIAAFKEAYINKILGKVGANVIDLASATAGEILINQHFKPSSNGDRDLGEATNHEWQDLYIVNTPTVSSDIRFKEDIQPLSYGLEDIMKINPISFTRPTEKDKEHFGFSAQELQDILPEIVNNGETLSLRLDEIIPVLVNAIQEQQKQIDELK